MKKNLLLFILITFLFSFSQTASAQVNYFSKTYGTSTNNEATRVVKELPDGNFLILGESTEKNNPKNIKWELIKTKPNGELIFTRAIKSLANNSISFELSIDPDGNYIAEAQISGLNWLKIIADTNGGVIKNIVYNLPLDTFLPIGSMTVNVRKRADKGYYIFGYYNQMNYLVHTDQNFKTLWTKNLFPDDTLRTWLYDVIYHDNKYIIAAMASLDTTYKYRGLILQSMDDNGNLIVKNHFPGKLQRIIKIIPTNDGNYLIGGNSFTDHRHTSVANYDVLITKFTPALDTVWNKLYYHEPDTSFATMQTDRLGDIEATADGGAIIYSFISNGNDSSVWGRSLIKIDTEGNKLCERDLYSIDSVATAPFFNIYRDLIITSDGGYGLVGSKKVNESSDYFFLKTNAYGLMSGIKENKIINNKLLTVYPNPSSGNVTIQFAENENVCVSKGITLYDITGREVRKYSNIKGNSFIIQRESLQKGLYLLRVNDEAGNNIQQAKLIFE